MYNKYIYLFLGLFFLASCGGNETVVTPTSYTKIELKIAPKIGSKTLELGKYFPLSADDSLMVSRLSFYVSNLTFTDSISNKEGFAPLYLFHKKSSDSILYTDSARELKNINRITFLAGLSDFANNVNPTSFPYEHPQSTANEMYWNEWTKYRFVIFEGEIKKKTGEKVTFSYHSGLTFKREILVSKNISINQGTTNKILFNLSLDKIFYPDNSSNKIDVFNGENFGHSDPSDVFVTNKFLNNFKNSFSL
jgi:hypothetical protein